jgi:hypothetical protein
MATWFCDAYASWQKGAVENANRRLRRDLPRDLDLDALRAYLVRHLGPCSPPAASCAGGGWMSRRVSVRDDGWRLPDALWGKMEPLLPERPRHPLGCHNPRVPDRSAMDAIFFVLRTGCQGNALNATGICSSSSAHRRFLEWTQAGVFAEFWR